MRPLVYLALVGLVGEGEAQDIQIRRVQSPPPTTFTALRASLGPDITGACDLPPASVRGDSLTPISLPDTTVLNLPPGWMARPRLAWDLDNGSLVIAGPSDTRLRINRPRSGSIGRSYLRYQNDALGVGPTCEVNRGTFGVIWTFYEPDPDVPNTPRPFAAFGEVMLPAGRWYKVSLWASTRAAREQVASVFTEAVLLPTP